MKLIWSAESLDEIQNIASYISVDNPTAAVEMSEQIFSSVEQILPDNPHAGRPGRIDGTRELVVHTSYIVVYEINNEIDILAVRHTARLWPEEF